MSRTSVGKKLYFSVIAVFIAFAAAFIVFQHEREKQYKIDMLDTRLQDYNERMAEVMSLDKSHSERDLDEYVKRHYKSKIRVTLVDTKGNVLYDNRFKNYHQLENHLNRSEIRQALNMGHGFSIDRKSSTLGESFFYSATFHTRNSSSAPHCPTTTASSRLCRPTSTTSGLPSPQCLS